MICYIIYSSFVYHSLFVESIIYNFINKDKIEESFLKCDEMEPLLAGIPIYLNLNSKTALYGAAYYGAFSE